MNIVGAIIGHDASACLLEDGKITRYMQEDRYTRIKGNNTAPWNAMLHCIDGKQIDKYIIPVAFVGSTSQYIYQLFDKENKYRDLCSKLPPVLCADEVMMDIPHHGAHAASAYYTSGWDDALIITCDGVGGDYSLTVSRGTKNTIEPIRAVGEGYYRGHQVRKFDTTWSLGWFYAAATEAMGWFPGTDEGKTMGLAPYGKHNETLYAILESMRTEYKTIMAGAINGRMCHHYGQSLKMRGLIGKYGREDFAHAAQEIVEDRLCHIVGRWMQRTGAAHLCLAGGVFMNVKLNQKIAEKYDTWIFPLASDCGVPVGGALYYYHHICKQEYVPCRLREIYWGTCPATTTARNTEELLERVGAKYTTARPSDIANLLSAGKIVSVCSGPLEGGARSLGNRSILMDARSPKAKARINRDVKYREMFRPFCPSVLAEDWDEYFVGTPSEHMIIGCGVKNASIPAVTHVDGTSRPQSVAVGNTSILRPILEEFKRLTGCSVLLNTSFNVMGEPMIRTAEEALKCFYSTGIDAMYLNGYLITKP